MGKILIQANNLDTVIDTFMYLYIHPDCKKEDLAEYCGFTLRQADYYTNACKYLDLLDDAGKPTPLAMDIFHKHPAQITERVYERIIGDELMGKIFARMIALPDEEIKEFAEDITKEYFPGYSETVYERRSDNIVKWCRKIIKDLKK